MYQPIFRYFLSRLYKVLFLFLKHQSTSFTINPLTTMFLSYRNQSVDLQSKSTDWFLYDGKIVR